MKNIIKFISLVFLFSILLSHCKLSVKDTQNIDIDYYKTNDENVKLAKELFYYDRNYFAFHVPSLNEETSNGIRLGYFIRSSDGKPTFQVIYDMKNVGVIKYHDQLKMEFSSFVPKLANDHALKTKIFKQLEPIGKAWIEQLFSNSAEKLYSQSSKILQKNVDLNKFKELTAKLFSEFKHPIKIDYLRSQYYKKFNDVPESISMFYTLTFSPETNKENAIIRISFRNENSQWRVIGFKI